MTLGTHAAIGAIIISKFPNHSILGFCLAFGSHFVLDAFPHWDYHLSSFQENKKDPMKNRMPITGKLSGDMFKMGVDFLLGTIAALWLFSNMNSVLILFGIVGGVLPDFLQFIYFQVQKEPLVMLQKFHIWIHTKIKMKNDRALSMVSQVILVAVVYLIFSGNFH